ncbi:MAG: response regulator [Erythrobacter sp.]
MAANYTLLLLEDEPLILMDLEFAAEDCGCVSITAASSEAALKILGRKDIQIDMAILDVSLGAGDTCFPVAHELEQLNIPYILHSGDLDRHNERIRQLDAQLIAKPAAAERVVGAAIAHAQGGEAPPLRPAAR